MHQQHRPVRTRVPPVRLWQVEREEAWVVAGGEAQPVQAHAQINIIYGKEAYSLRHLLQPQSEGAGVDHPSSPGVGRIGAFVEALWNVVFCAWLSIRHGVNDHVPHKEVQTHISLIGVDLKQVVLVPLFVQEIHEGACSHKDIIIPFEYEGGARAVLLEPSPEQEVLQGQVKEGVLEVPLQDVCVLLVLQLKKVLQVRVGTCAGVLLTKQKDCPHQSPFLTQLPLHQPTAPPRLSNGLSVFKVPHLGFDGHEEHGGIQPRAPAVPGTDCWLVDEEGVLPAVHGPAERSDLFRQAAQVIHAWEPALVGWAI